MSNLFAKPKIIAIGGAGIKIAERLRAGALSDTEFLGVDISSTPAPFEVLNVGGATLGFLGSGGDPEVAERACEAYRDILTERLKGTNWIFLIAGLGGGTASAVAPIVADCAQKCGCLVMSFVTLPFSVEGSRRTSQAKDALAKLRSSTSIVVPLPNDQLSQNNPSLSAQEALLTADGIIARGIKSLTSAICAPGLLEVDFTAVQKIFGCKAPGKTLFALGSGEGPSASANAFAQAAAFGSLHTSETARHADHLLISVRTSNELGLKEINDLAASLAEKFGCRGERLVGAAIDPTWKEKVEVMVMGVQDIELRKKPAPAPVKTSRSKTKPTDPQIEISFSNLSDHRGLFEATEPNLFRGEDVDIPTYLRRNIKLLS